MAYYFAKGGDLSIWLETLPAYRPWQSHFDLKSPFDFWATYPLAAMHRLIKGYLSRWQWELSGDQGMYQLSFNSFCFPNRQVWYRITGVVGPEGGWRCDENKGYLGDLQWLLTVSCDALMRTFPANVRAKFRSRWNLVPFSKDMFENSQWTVGVARGMGILPPPAHNGHLETSSCTHRHSSGTLWAFYSSLVCRHIASLMNILDLRIFCI